MFLPPGPAGDQTPELWRPLLLLVITHPYKLSTHPNHHTSLGRATDIANYPSNRIWQGKAKLTLRRQADGGLILDPEVFRFQCRLIPLAAMLAWR